MRPSRARHALLRTRHLAAEWLQGARERVYPSRQRVSLDDVRRRLEIVLAATYDRAIPVTELPDDKPPRGVRRWVAMARSMGRTPVATTDGHGILLPPDMPADMRAEDAITHYRLLAMEQAERLVRATAVHAPADDALTRDLYLLREAREIDRTIARNNIGLADDLARARGRALASRPSTRRMSEQERAVEGLLRNALGEDLDTDDGGVALSVRRRYGHAGSRRKFAGCRAVTAV